MDHYITKPFDSAALLALVAEYLRMLLKKASVLRSKITG